MTRPQVVDYVREPKMGQFILAATGREEVLSSELSGAALWTMDEAGREFYRERARNGFWSIVK